MSVVLITGGTGAVGSALVEEFAGTDDAVFTYFSNEQRAGELEREFRCKGFRMDASEMASVRECVKAVLGEFGRIDILVNNAGISRIEPFMDEDEDDWQRIISCDLTSCMRVSRVVCEDMLRRKSGAVVNISSVWGVYGASCEVAYSAAKAGVIGFTKALAKELGPSGITVNAVAPGVIDSPMNTSHLSRAELDELCENTPLGRLGKPSEVAKAVRALAENRFITGQILGVDGGFC